MTEHLGAFYKARDLMREALERDLMGGPDDQELDEKPLDRFIVGLLHPVSPEPVEDAGDVPDAETGGQPDAAFDPGVNLSHLRYPSSMGMTFGVDPRSTPMVVLEITADRYVQRVADVERVVSADGNASENLDDEDAVTVRHDDSVPTTDDRSDGLEPDAFAAESSAAGEADRESWKRIAIGPVDRTLDVTRPGRASVSLTEGLSLRTVVRPAADGVANVTVVLVNEFVRPAVGPADEWCWSRPRIVATAPDGAFSERRPARVAAFLPGDERSADLLYRDAVSIAVGHGCSVTWAATRPVTRLETTFFPRQEVLVSRATRADLPALSMACLAGTDDRAPLRAIIARYRAWIADEQAAIGGLDPAQQAVALEHLRAAREAAERMEAGVQALDADPVAARAFRVMNAAMQEQRSRQVMIRSRTADPGSAEHHWRPFQMAFILLNLPGLVDPTQPDRDLADLLWFPTGGGKTEAYLGLIAFALALRRLRSRPGGGGGVGVLMRYTLRLLTLQQFERAAGLICALEAWRQDELPDAAPVSIGLWVGQAATPNDVKAAAKALRRLESGSGEDDAGNPRQLLRCPWCGSDLPLSAYNADRRADRLWIRCPSGSCRFSSGLPVLVVDSDVYADQPSLLIGTVDKFALLAWREQAKNLFGTDGAVDPPDLIVQDELHLISGPLGTLVGLYETAVDAASTRTVRPKLVASTATIRRAAEQVRAVFARESRQFPPPGIDPGDSFFAVEAPREELPSREYVGVMAPGTSHATLLVRSYAALLQAGQELEAPDDVRDAYWTLLGYFNSLRVLGAAFIQSIDDVPDRMRVVARRSGHEQREPREPRELTSRKRSSEIPEELDRLGTSYPSEESPDIVLATNMISVGVDVDRLGLMVVMGQPQTTSEYIQATSRVGRQRPGLVITLFNAARARDLSHYEAFVPYHRALYRQVEATGATPFAPRAVDRGLHGMLVAAARLLVPGASGERDLARAVTREGRHRLKEVILARVRSVAPEEEDRVDDALEELFAEWENGLGGEVRRYAAWERVSDALIVPAGGAPGRGSAEGLLEQFPVTAPPWPTLTSLRNVDGESTLFVTRRRRSRER